MRRLIAVMFVVALCAVPVHAQTFEATGNPIVVAGGTYQLTQPDTGSRAAFLLSANVAGVKLGTAPLYLGGVGVALPTAVSSVASQFGNFVMLTIPGVTWYPSGNNPGTLSKICIQVGYAYVLSGDVQARSGIYAGLGFGWDSPAYLKYKREMKKYAKAKASGKLMAGPPPVNPYDVH